MPHHWTVACHSHPSPNTRCTPDDTECLLSTTSILTCPRSWMGFHYPHWSGKETEVQRETEAQRGGGAIQRCGGPEPRLVWPRLTPGGGSTVGLGPQTGPSPGGSSAQPGTELAGRRMRGNRHSNSDEALSLRAHTGRVLYRREPARASQQPCKVIASITCTVRSRPPKTRQDDKARK